MLLEMTPLSAKEFGSRSYFWFIFAIAVHPLLSSNILHLILASSLLIVNLAVLSSLASLSSGMISLVAMDNAMTSLSVLDKLITVCSLLAHMIGHPAYLTT